MTEAVAVSGHPGVFLCLLNVLLRYRVVGGEKSNRMRNCVKGRNSFRITGGVRKIG